MISPNLAAHQPNGKPQTDRLFRRETVAALERQLAADRAAIRRRIRGRVVYIDKIKFLADQRFTDEMREAIAATICGDKPPAYPVSRAIRWPYGCEIAQPTPATFACIAELMAGHHIVSYLEIAVDFIAATEGIARILVRELNLVTTQPRRGSKRKTGRSGDTYYLAARRTRPDDIHAPKTRRNAAFYFCFSKILTGQPAAHICFRLGNAGICADRGIRTAADLLARDPATIITKEDFRRTAINWAGVDRQIAGDARNRANGDPELQAEIEQQLWDEICAAVDSQMPRGETLADLKVQDIIDSHWIFRRRGAAVHRPFGI